MIRVLQLLLVVAVFLAVLCGPVVLLARRLYRRGYPGAARWLRVIVPAQLVVSLGVIVAADAYWRYDLPAVIVVATLAGSVLGASALWLTAKLFPARLL